jgi:hypothetical protein
MPLFCVLLPGMCMLGIQDAPTRGQQLLLTILSFGIPLAGDTVAYFVGSRFGARRLCPAVSPNKSLEGAAAGLLGSVQAGVLLCVAQMVTSLGIGIYLGKGHRHRQEATTAPMLPPPRPLAQMVGDTCRSLLTMCGFVVLAAALLSLGIPFLLPHMHDRYFFLADVLTVILAFMYFPWGISLAVLCQFASLLGYHAYLKMRYLLTMNYGAIALIAVLLVISALFVKELFLPQFKPLKKK